MGTVQKILLAAGILAVFHFGLVIVFGDKGVAELYRQRSDYQHQLEDNRQLERHNLALLERIERLQNDPAFLEAVARQQLMVRPDEIVISLPPSAGGATEP